MSQRCQHSRNMVCPRWRGRGGYGGRGRYRNNGGRRGARWRNNAGRSPSAAPNNINNNNNNN